MADKSGKTDWQEHARRFKELQESQGMKIKEYAALNGLNENSARRAINQVIKSLENGDQNKSDQKKSDQKVERRGRPKKEAKAAPAVTFGLKPGARGEGKRTSSNAPKDTRDHGNDSPLNRKKSDHNSGKKKPDLTVVMGEVIELPKGKRGARKGSQNALTTGTKKTITDEDVDAALRELTTMTLPEDFIDSAEARMMVNLLAHENLIRRALDKSLRRLTREMLENQANPPVLESDSTDGITILPTPAEFKMLKMLNDTGYSLANISSTVSQLRARIEKEARDKELHAQKTEQHIQKTRQAEEAHQLRMYGKMKGEVLADAFALLQGDSGSAQKAAMFLEMRGITVPDTIRRLLDIEMEQERNKVDESTGITAEELDAYVAAAEAKRAGHHEWLANKRQIVAAIVDEHGYGDLDEDGVRRSDEIQAPFQPGEEIDYSATADMYNDAPVPSGGSDEGSELTPEAEDAELWQGESHFSDDDDEPDEEIGNWRGDH